MPADAESVSNRLKIPDRLARFLSNVSLTRWIVSAAVLISADALVQEGTAIYVFVVDNQKKAHRRPVTVGIVAQGQAEILSGVKAGEPVVVRGQTALPDGATVEAAEAAK